MESSQSAEPLAVPFRRKNRVSKPYGKSDWNNQLQVLRSLIEMLCSSKKNVKYFDRKMCRMELKFQLMLIN